MSTNPKNGGKNPKNVCQAEIRPQFAKVPCRRDQRAYKLRVAGLTQERIAQKLGCSQPTVHRGIGRMEKWVATTLPEDRGEFVATEKFRLALHRHETLLEHLQRRALRDYRRSRRPVPVEKVVTRKVTRTKGDEQTVTDETRTEKCNKPQRGQVALLSYAGKVSHELAVMASGWIGPGNGIISMAEVMDPEERDRWDRTVKNREATIGQLEKRVAELEAKVQSGVGFQPAQESTPHAPREDVISRSEMSTILDPTEAGNGLEAYPTGELKPVENAPVVNEVPSLDAVATPTQPAVCDQPLNTSQEPAGDAQNVNKNFGGAGFQPAQQSTLHAPREEVLTRSNERGREEFSPRKPLPTPSQPEPEEKRFRWEDKYRQEALDYHCMIHGIPPLELHQVSGIPDPKKISPKLWMQRGYPYMIYSDRSIPSKREPARDTRKVIQVW